MSFIASPLNYIGGKYKLLNQIMPLLPPSACFLDLFCGGGNVGINARADTVIFNDKNAELIALLDYLRQHPADDIAAGVFSAIERFGLSDSARHGYAHYGCDSSKGLGSRNKEAFLALRRAYNESRDTALLYALVIFSFNNQIRFNRQGEFNLPVGKRDFNVRMQEKLQRFCARLGEIDAVFRTDDFRRIDLSALPPDTLVYCDPPYLITLAGYNEQGGWTEQDERDLLDFLDRCHAHGLKFALSNVLQAKNRENTLLAEWLGARGYRCHFLDKNYANSNYQRKERQSVSTEVLITNYAPPA
ncbi:DNA adenine methylase [Bergeriella denitrificans]|uniref:Site-specific DNA-methyltransferase (adenine-specific) n=1 Tax=Bergeriella denitrificans TaxID=494 RepID=A0A378UD96_BERDE|nr:DNA adenine methylase [Bergeriella denitrificans]STZ75346.1 putative type II DNA modification methylase [Bergeriella denitrificans]